MFCCCWCSSLQHWVRVLRKDSLTSSGWDNLPGCRDSAPSERRWALCGHLRSVWGAACRSAPASQPPGSWPAAGSQRPQSCGISGNLPESFPLPLEKNEQNYSWILVIKSCSLFCRFWGNKRNPNYGTSSQSLGLYPKQSVCRSKMATLLYWELPLGNSEFGTWSSNPTNSSGENHPELAEDFHNFVTTRSARKGSKFHHY